MSARPCGPSRTRAASLAAGGIAVLPVAILLTACGGGSSGVVRPPTTAPSAPSAVSTPPSAPASRPVASSPPGASSATRTTTPAGRQTVTVSPHTGLRDGQQVRVTAAGFSPGEPLQVIQCADKGKATGPGDCNLTGMLTVSADADGRVDVRLKVLRGPFGTNRIVCGAQQHCLVSVTQAAMQPSEEADAPITFAG